MLHDGRSPKECESCQCDTSNGFWMVWCQPSNARRTQSLATRRTERWVVGTSLKSARAGIKHQWCKNKRCKPLRAQEQGRLKLAMGVPEKRAQAQRVQELTEPTLQLSAAYLWADVSHGSMPVSTPNTLARREAHVSFQEPSDRSIEQRTAWLLEFSWQGSAMKL